ncbi:MAG: hypothetical protein WAM42_06035 [Candidatus Nitrosopolaris sp.]|jgi:hypothetical protein
MGNTRFPKMISLGLRLDKSKKIKICCQDMKEDGCDKENYRVQIDHSLIDDFNAAIYLVAFTI